MVYHRGRSAPMSAYTEQAAHSKLEKKKENESSSGRFTSTVQLHISTNWPNILPAFLSVSVKVASNIPFGHYGLPASTLAVRGMLLQAS